MTQPTPSPEASPGPGFGVGGSAEAAQQPGESPQEAWERIGAELVQEAARKTGETAGGGSTTTAVLAQAMVRQAMRAVAGGADPLLLRRGIEQAASAIADQLLATAEAVGTPRPPGKPVRIPVVPPRRKKKTPTLEQSIRLLRAVTDTASGDPDAARLAAAAVELVGTEGTIVVEGPTSARPGEVELTQGMTFDRGSLSPYFFTDPERGEAALEDPYLLLSGSRITSIQDLLPVLEQVVPSGKPLLVIAEDVDGDALSTLVVNKLRGTFTSVAVKAPGQAASLADLAILTGGQVIDDLPSADLAALGRARKAVITKDETTIVDGAGEPEEIQGRVEEIRAEIASSDSDYDRERLARLTGGVAVIKIGAETESELKERERQIVDAVRTAKAAVEEGVVAGGGVALVQAAEPAFESLRLFGDEATGADIVKAAVEAPLNQIAINVGLPGTVVTAKVKTLPQGHGLNVTTGQYEDLFAAGVIDPAKVARSALQNAASIAALFLTTEAAVGDEPETTRG